MNSVDTGTPTRATLDHLTDLGLGADPLGALADLVSDDLGCPGARVLTVRVENHPYDRPALTTGARYLVSGTAGIGPGDARAFVFFVKRVRPWAASPLATAVPEPLRSRLAPMVPWRTEPDLYRSDLGSALPPGLVLPRAYLVADCDDSAVIWLQQLRVRPGPWYAERYRRAAYLLGRLAGSPTVAPFAAHVPVARTPRSFADIWLELAVVPELRDDATWRRPLVASTFDDALRRRLLLAVDRLAELVGELESLPWLTAHGDACPDNLLVVPGRHDAEDLALIDFGFWGTAPVGFDLCQLVLGEIQLGRLPADSLREMADACLAAYVQGLQDEDFSIPADEVRRAFALTLAVFHAIPALPYEHRGIEPGLEAEPLYANRAATVRYVLDLLVTTKS